MIPATQTLTIPLTQGKTALVDAQNYDRPEDAARAYDQTARELFGRWAKVNFAKKGEWAT